VENPITLRRESRRVFLGSPDLRATSGRLGPSFVGWVVLSYLEGGGARVLRVPRSGPVTIHGFQGQHSGNPGKKKVIGRMKSTRNRDSYKSIASSAISRGGEKADPWGSKGPCLARPVPLRGVRHSRAEGGTAGG